MRKLVAVMLMSALSVGAISTPAWASDAARADGKDKSINANIFALKTSNQGEINKEGGRRKARRHIIRGEITSLGDGSFVMKTRRGPVTVKFGEDTRFKGGDQSNLKVGTKIGVVPRGCAKKPEVSGDKARAGGEVRGRKGARARLCLDATRPGAKASAEAADGGNRKAVRANAAPRTITAKAILFPRTAP